MREILARIADWFRRDRLERELADELSFHRAQLERDAAHDGVSADEAAWAARRRLGNATAITEQSRERWALPALDQLLQDARYALRGMRRAPGFTATVVVTLALGIGANAAMFGVVDGLMFRPYPYMKEPGLTHRVYLRTMGRGEERIQGWGIEYTRYLDFRKHTTSFDELAAFSDPNLAVGTGINVRERRVGAVSGTFWSFFDAVPAAGRFFTPAEDQTPLGADVAVLSWDFWQSEFGGRDVLGQRLQLGHIGATIIGVAPRGFTGIRGEAPAAFIPITLYAGSNPAQRDRERYYNAYEWGWATIMARRKPGVSVEQASADLTQAYRISWTAEKAAYPLLPPIEIAQPTAIAGGVKEAAGPQPALEARVSLWLTGVAAIVLLIACANVANLFLARALRRQREIAVRLALGVSRERLVRQTLTESLILALVGAVAGLLVAQWGGAAIRGMLATTTDTAGYFVFTDARTIGVATAIAVLAAVITGMVPALVTRKADLSRALKAGAREGMTHRSRARVALLLAQGALSVVLLVGAGLFLASLRNVQDVRMGYDAEGALIVYRNLRGTQLDSAERVAMRRAMVEHARTIPGVSHAAWISSIPFWSTSSTDLHVPGIDSVRRLGSFTYQLTTPAFFDAMGTRVIRGRGFTDADHAGAPRVAVVSEGMAGVLWPGRDAIGQCMRVGSDTLPCTTVVGIAEDIVQRQEQLERGQRFHYYMPIEQYNPTAGNYMVLRTAGDAEALRETARKSLQAIMPGESYVTIRLLRDAVEGVQRAWRLGATLFLAFGGLALVVAAIGLYGVVAYSVNQRMHELGVRVALGAQRDDILRLVVSQSARLSLAGVAIGCVLALIASRWVQPLLFRQDARDPVIYVTVAAIMVMVALAAAVSPAVRAAKADPNSALRAE